MKSIDLSKLTYERLQRYRKSLTDRYSVYEYWNDTQEPKAKEIRGELDRVLTECAKRNKDIIKQQRQGKWTHVSTVKEGFYKNKK